HRRQRAHRKDPWSGISDHLSERVLANPLFDRADGIDRLAQTHPEVMQKAFYDHNPVGTRHYTSMLFVQGRDPLTQTPILDAHQRQHALINPKDAFLTEEVLQSLEGMPGRRR